MYLSYLEICGQFVPTWNSQEEEEVTFKSECLENSSWEKKKRQKMLQMTQSIKIIDTLE